MAHGRSSRAGIVNGASNETRGQCGLAANPRAAPRVAHVIRLIGSVNRRALHRNETTLQASQLAGHARDLSAEVNECLLREAVLGHQLPDECGQLPQRRRQSVSVGWSPTGGNCRRRGVPCLRRPGGRRSRRGGFASRSRCKCSASPPRVRTRRGRPRYCRRRGLNRAALARDDVADVLQRRQSRRAVGGERVGRRPSQPPRKIRTPLARQPEPEQTGPADVKAPRPVVVCPFAKPRVAISAQRKIGTRIGRKPDGRRAVFEVNTPKFPRAPRTRRTRLRSACPL